jgi:hypothetical protein
MSQQYGIGTDGKPIYNTPVDNGPTTGPSTTGTSSSSSTSTTNTVSSILGSNLGIGHGLYTGSNGLRNVTLEFRTIVAGDGILIADDVNHLTITATGTTSTAINDLRGILSVPKGGTGVGGDGLPVHGLLLGNGVSPIQSIAVPEVLGASLTWTGTDYAWLVPVQEPSGVQSITLAPGSARISIDNGTVTDTGTVTLDVVETNLSINNLFGTLGIAKGGTGASVFTTNGVVIGGTSALGSTVAPTAANQALTWNGSAFTWKSYGSVTSIGITPGSSKLAVSSSPITTAGNISVDVVESNLNHANIGGVLPTTKGGTGLTSMGLPAQVLRVNSGSTGLEYTTLLASDIQDLSVVASTGHYDDLVGKPTFAPVSFTGSYNDLVDKPFIGVGSVTSITVNALSNKIVANGGTITSSGTFDFDVNEPALTLNNLGGTLGVTKGGSGRAAHTVNGILLGNGTGAVNFIAPPTTANTVLKWDGSAFVWSTPTSGTVTSVGLTAGSSKVSVTGGPITSSGVMSVDVIESNLNLNNMNGVLGVSKGGTGGMTFPTNGLIVGNGEGSMTSIAAPASSDTYLHWDGSAYTWVTISKIVTLNALNDVSIVGLADSSILVWNATTQKWDTSMTLPMLMDGGNF